MKQLQGLSKGDELTIGEVTHTVQGVHLGSVGALAHVRTKCDNIGCPVEKVGNEHRLYEKDLLDWEETGHLQRKS